MIFNVNQTEFKNDYQKEVWRIGKAILPLEITIPDIADPEMREGCTQIYNWTMEYIESQYKNLDKYSGSIYKMFRLLDDVAENAEIINGGMAFSYKKYDNQISINPCLSDLPFVGLELVDGDGCKILRNKKYPLFCQYFKLFYDAASKRVNRLYYLMYNDFRVLAPKYKRTPDDLFRTMSDEYKAFFKELHEYVLSKGAKLEPHKYFMRFRYIYKNEFVLIFEPHLAKMHHIIEVPYSLKSDWHGSLKLFLKEIEKQPDKNELIKYIQDEICLCGNCNNGNNGCGIYKREPTDICGKKRYVAGCHRTITKWHKKPLDKQIYTDYDIKMLKRMLDIQFHLINNL
ncbi:MAG: hypothetical protein PHV32_02000 [Eubacteriales bacterium]|nr:hypothetical protein [Eubacteriales bacterium]